MFIVFIGNYFVSTLYFSANTTHLKVSNFKVIRDNEYKDTDLNKDWNSMVIGKVRSKNIFFKPIANSFLVSVDGNTVVGHIDWSFNLFNIFNFNEPVVVTQTFMMDDTTYLSPLTFKLDNSKQIIPIKKY
ncbi:hypothetical protein JNUCC83_12295 (plasmid) [Vagococcus sp. JNUCC 83]